MSDIFGEPEGTALVAVERANGGELAPISQVLWTQSQWAPTPSEADFADSVELLIEAGLVEYVAGQLGLTPAGRKLLRKVPGLPGDANHVAQVTELLEAVDPDRLAEPGSRPAPTEEEVRLALEEEEQVTEAGDSFGSTPGGIDAPVYDRGQAFGGRWQTSGMFGGTPSVLPLADGGSEPEELDDDVDGDWPGDEGDRAADSALDGVPGVGAPFGHPPSVAPLPDGERDPAE